MARSPLFTRSNGKGSALLRACNCTARPTVPPLSRSISFKGMLQPQATEALSFFFTSAPFSKPQGNLPFFLFSPITRAKAAYNIGGLIITANSIEHSILHCQTPRVGRWFEAIISTAMRKKSAEEKQLISSNFTLLTSQPLVLFALCAGGSSDPTLRVYTAKSVLEELDMAKKDFLQANVLVKKSRKIFLPKLLDRYAKEAGLSCEDLVAWVSANMEKKMNDALPKCIDGKNKKIAQVVEWLPYNSKFRYVFVKDLTEKPWFGHRRWRLAGGGAAAASSGGREAAGGGRDAAAASGPHRITLHWPVYLEFTQIWANFKYTQTGLSGVFEMY